MAVTAPTKLADFNAGFLTPAMAGPIFELAARRSAIMQLAQQVPLGANGVNIPVVSGRLSAGWVAEGGQKPASNAAVSLKTMAPKKIAAISVVSAEVVRANPANYMDLLRPQIAEAFAVAFDYAATQNAGPDGAPAGGAFPTYLAQGSKVTEIGTASQGTGGVYKDFVSALSLLVNNQNAMGRTYRMNGTALSPRAEPLLLGATDTTGRPLLLTAPYDGTVTQVNSGALMGRPVFISDGVDYHSTLGWMGDWTQAAWGVVGGISYDVSTEATVTINGALVSLFEYNLVAVRAEAEYGFLVNDTAAFVELTDVETS